MDKVDFWHKPLAVTENNFVYKSLSSWACNIAVGCEHACRFCYVPDVSTRKLGDALAKHGVKDPDAEWGDYVLLRPYEPEYFARTVASAEAKPLAKLNWDGNRAVMFCTTTDPYQTLKHPNADRRKELNEARRRMVREALLTILTRSTLNVRILTRSPLAREDFDIMAKFGKRLLFGMSIPTLNNKLAKVYEPSAPAPSQRLATLIAANEYGLHTYVAIAPTYPECHFADIAETIKAVKTARPVTIFAEPINIRAENVERIRLEGVANGIDLNVAVFENSTTWSRYALGQLRDTEEAARSLGVFDKLHLWPDAALGGKQVRAAQPDAAAHELWLKSYWFRKSAWPK
jgi:DNA repair photolyase